MQPYSPRLPWIQYAPHAHGGFIVQDTRTGEVTRVATPDDIHHFAATHSAAPGYRGVGDAVRAVTSRMGIGSCTPCAKRQAALNATFPRFWRR